MRGSEIFKVEDEGSSLEGDRFIHSIRGGHLLRTELKRNGIRSRRVEKVSVVPGECIVTNILVS